MRTLRTMIVLGLAGLALVKGRELLAAKLPTAKARFGKARERIEPVLRQATSAVRDASKDAAESVRDTSLSAAETADAVANAADSVAKAIADSAQGGRGGQVVPPSARPAGSSVNSPQVSHSGRATDI